MALVALGTYTPNLTVAQDRLQTQDRLLLMQTPGSCIPACLPAPTKDQLQTRDQLQTPTTATLTATQPQQLSPAVTQTMQQNQTPVCTGDLLQKRQKDQIRLIGRTGGAPR